MVLAVDAKKEAGWRWHVYLAGGRKDMVVTRCTGVQEAVGLGAGKFLTSMDKDGTKSGFHAVAPSGFCCSIIAFRKAGSSQHISRSFEKTAATALAASDFPLWSGLHQGNQKSHAGSWIGGAHLMTEAKLDFQKQGGSIPETTPAKKYLCWSIQ